jgi:hypothetical protein
MRLGHAIAAAAAAAVALVAAAPARADDTDDKRDAARLFKEGRAAVKAGDLDEACDKFEASFRLDPAIGTKLNLADCFEQKGLLVAAYRLFDEAAAEAARTSKEGRESFARDRADALATRLYLLTLELVDPAPNTTVTVAGVVVAPAAWAAPRALLPGSIAIAVTAPGRTPYHTRVDGGAGESRTLRIPALAPLAPGEVDPTVGAATGGPGADLTARPARPSRRLAYIVGGSGAGLLATSLVLGLVARSRYQDADCGPDHGFPDGTCSATGQAQADRARTLADVGTGFAVAGVAAVGVGVYLFLRGGGGSPPDDRDTGGLTISPTVSGDGVGVIVTLAR